MGSNQRSKKISATSPDHIAANVRTEESDVTSTMHRHQHPKQIQALQKKIQMKV
jgi:hypothetical protein